MAEKAGIWTATIAAALLRRGRMLQIASLVVLALTIMEMGRSPWLFAGGGILALAGTWFAFRVALDGDLFAALAQDGDLATFDAAMRALGLMAPERQVGDLTARARSAIGLLKWQGACFVLQVCWLAIGLIASVSR